MIKISPQPGDNTAYIQQKINEANANRGEVVYFEPGEYLVSNTINVTSGVETLPSRCCKLEGENANTVTIKLAPTFPVGDPVFSFLSLGAGGTLSSAGIKNISILGVETATPGIYDWRGTGIKVNCLNFAQFENIRIFGLFTGIELATDNIRPGYPDAGWTEFNQFNRIELHLCKTGILMSSGNPQGGSFHGNNLETIIINIPENAVAWRVDQQCHYYNGRFNILAWAHSDTSDLLNCDGDCEGNVGNISIECGLKPSGGNYVSKIKGNKRFWFDGYLIVAGGNQNVSVEMANLPAGQGMEMPGFVCNNNLGKPNYVGATGAKILPVSQFKEIVGNAVSPMVYGLYRDNMQSVGINTYSGPNNGLYLTQSGYQESISQAKNGFYLDASGNEIKSFASPRQGGFNVNTETGFAIRFGMVAIPEKPRDEEFEMRVILEAEHLISGRLYITTGKMDNAYAASAVFDIHTGPNTSPSNRQILVQESFGWDPNNLFAEKLNAEVKMPPILMQEKIQVLIGANTFKSEQILHFHFIGLIL